jgi:hypothetical protein
VYARATQAGGARALAAISERYAPDHGVLGSSDLSNRSQTCGSVLDCRWAGPGKTIAAPGAVERAPARKDRGQARQHGDRLGSGVRDERGRLLAFSCCLVFFFWTLPRSDLCRNRKNSADRSDLIETAYRGGFGADRSHQKDRGRTQQNCRIIRPQNFSADQSQ